MRTAAFHPEAEAELNEAAQWYEGRSVGLGDRFLDAVDERLLQILRSPESWGILRGDVRYYHLPHFPLRSCFKSKRNTYSSWQ
jgi:toxin ParE1/3/4